MALSNNLIGYGQGNDKLNRAYPSWMSNGFSYGNSYEGPQTEKTFAAPGVDPYSLLPLNPTPVAAPTFDPAMQGYGYGARQAAPGGGAPEGGAPGEAGNGQGNTGNGSFPDMRGALDGFDMNGARNGATIGGLAGIAGPIAGLVGTIGGGLIGGLWGGGGSGQGTAKEGWGGLSEQGGYAEPGGPFDTAQNNGPAPDAPSNFHGGIITHNKLTGPDPKGPDEGYASIQTGEGVLTRAAVKHYGKGLVNKLNRLAVSKEALR